MEKRARKDDRNGVSGVIDYYLFHFVFFVLLIVSSDGKKDSATTAPITSHKLSLTKGILPKKYPVSKNKYDQAAAPITLNRINFLYGIPTVAAEKGIMLRITGINRPNVTAQGPCPL